MLHFFASIKNDHWGQEKKFASNQPNCIKAFGTNVILRRHLRLVHNLELPASAKGPRPRFTAQELRARNVRGV
jgi:hypothetical protein